MPCLPCLSLDRHDEHAEMKEKKTIEFRRTRRRLVTPICCVMHKMRESRLQVFASLLRQNDEKNDSNSAGAMSLNLIRQEVTRRIGFLDVTEDEKEIGTIQ